MPSVILDIEVEREKQDAKWGEQNHTDEWWLAILSEELGEVAQCILHDFFGGKAEGHLREELVQLVAVGVAWLECIDRQIEDDDDGRTNPRCESD